MTTLLLRAGFAPDFFDRLVDILYGRTGLFGEVFRRDFKGRVQPVLGRERGNEKILRCDIYLTHFVLSGLHL